MNEIVIYFSAIVITCASLQAPTREYLPGPPYPVLPEVNDPKSFVEFLNQTGKSYPDPVEYRSREGMFWYRKFYADLTNQYEKLDYRSFSTALNYYSDLSLPEISSKVGGYKKNPFFRTSNLKYSSTPVKRSDNSSLPDSFDWRDKGAVAAVKSQGLESDCGACWAFAVTGAIEGHISAKTGQLDLLSEQNLIDCSKDQGNDGCDGGFPFNGFKYVAENGGIAGGVQYPYTTMEGECAYSKDKNAARIKDFAIIRPGDEKEMKRVIANRGPIACSVHAELDSFILYKSGIYDDADCNDGELDHSILVVGYGSENGKDYWIIKNSWGTIWGEKGYMKLPRNKNSFCHIAEECSYPII